MKVRNRPSSGFTVYDIIEGKDIYINKNELMMFCESIKCDYTSFSKLRVGVLNHVVGRFILPSNKEKLFTLIDIDSKKEYQCINNRTIFYHFNLPYSDNEAKYVYELRSGRQNLASICGKVFRLKSKIENKHRFKKMKNESSFVDNKLNDSYIQKKIKNNLYCRIITALNTVGVKKNLNTMIFTGCTIIEFKKYIESKFSDKMNWDNRSLWHIDHIIPCEAFNLSDQSDQLKCFHYTNMQPIWKTNKTARKIGESDLYQGNQNKNNSLNNSYDYHAVNLIKKMIPEDAAIEMAKMLFNKGVRKVIIPLQDGSI